MAGLTVRNADGNISISSDFPPLTGITLRPIKSYSESSQVGGLDNIYSPWDDSKVYFDLSSTKFPELFTNDKPYAFWFQLYDGEDACPGGFFSANCGQICISNTVTPTKGKYLNVYDASGNLTWTVESCIAMPRVVGELYIPPTLKYGEDLVFTNIPEDVFFFMDCFYCDDDYGGESDVGNDSEVQMMAIKRSGTTITFQFNSPISWLVDNSAVLSTIFPQGIYIPYANISV